jgi:hypothetical protein
MQGPTDEAIIPTKHGVINGRVMGGTMRRKNGKRTMPVQAVVAAVAVAASALPSPLSEDEGLHAAKKPRLQAPSTFSNVADRVAADSPDDKPTAPTTSLPASRAPRRNWKGEEDAKLTDAVNKYGIKWVAVAAQVPGRTNE